jgi:hypothetical protein
VFGNKCTWQHNLKRVHFKETLASGNFLAWSSKIHAFLRTAQERSSLTMVGATPYKLFLKVLWVNKQLASSDLDFRKR